MRPHKTLVNFYLYLFKSDFLYFFCESTFCTYMNFKSRFALLRLLKDFSSIFPRENNDAINVGWGRSKTWLHEFLPWKNSFWILRQGPWMQWWRRIQNQNHAAELYIYELLQRKSQFFLFGSKTVNAEVAQNPKTKIWSWFLGGEDSSSRWKGFFALVRY